MIPSRGMGQGLAHPKGDWENSGSVYCKRPLIQSQGSGSGMGNVLNHSTHSKLLGHFLKSPSWMARLEGCEDLVGEK